MAGQNTSIRKVFISHATQDSELAHRLAGDLQQLGVPIWIAPESIRPGESWVDAIERGLGESGHTLVVLTPAALESRWVKKETNVAIALEREGRMEVIPLDVQPCDVPLLLKSYQMVSFRRDYDAGFSQLVGMLGLRAASREEEPPAAISPLPPVEPETVLIPAGEFLMGSEPREDGDARSDELFRHAVYLPDYFMARTPVTNAQYAVFVEAAGRKPPAHWKDSRPPQGKVDHPVVWVSWYDAMAYCKWLAEATGQPYRLPSEAEWEKAARGMDGRVYPWGNEWDAEQCNTGESGRGGTTPVGSYPQGQGASPYGVLDMAGNVWEWTRSKYKNYPYAPADGREDARAGADILRVMRGGSWFDLGSFARCAARRRGLPDGLWSSMGFRVCVSP
jgi:formylglycine-generating enzyme required for sulfatase activity